MSKKTNLKYAWYSHYYKEELLGKGGNARVFLVSEKETGNKYALKQLVKNDYKKIKRFKREIQASLKLMSQGVNVIPIIKYDLRGYWYIMPVGMNIKEYLEKKELNIQEIVKAVIQIAETLERMHENGISHRDVKPENILMCNNKLFLADLGLVNFADEDKNDDLTKEERQVGAKFTIAPEMKRNPFSADGKKADVYSLGKTMWILLTQNWFCFEGTYDFNDKSHSLHEFPRLKEEHLVELEEALKRATDNNPENRPDMSAFKCMLLKWCEIYESETLKQESEWRFIQKFLFANYPPTSAKWEEKEEILKVLNVVRYLPVFNHMMLPGGGGLDFERVEHAKEENCLYLYDSGGDCYIVKPKSLRYEAFNNILWNYFMLELDELKPVFTDNGESYSEILVENEPGIYVTGKYSQYGVIDYETGEKFKEGYKVVERILKGNILIVLKTGLYNQISSTYDGRHSLCTAEEFRRYIDWISRIDSKIIESSGGKDSILTYPELQKNPFDAVDDNNTIMEIDDIETADYKSYNFSEVMPKSDRGINETIRYSFIYSESTFSFSSLFGVGDSLFLCNNGLIGNEENEKFYLYDMMEAYSFNEKCKKLLTDNITVSDMDKYKVEFPFEIHGERIGKPTHLFTKDEIKELMEKADDRVNNCLVINGEGYAELIQDDKWKHYYPVSQETYLAGNIYVGKYSSLNTLDNDYISMLNGWKRYLEFGRFVYIDYDEECEENIEKIIEDIKRYY